MALLACSPALNWREVRLNRLTALLPCKPDVAQRTVRLGAQDVILDMRGCEAADGLFAVVHTRLAAPDQAAAVLADWRAGTLAHMQSASVTELPFRIHRANAPKGSTPFMLHVEGKRADGSALQARLVWFADGADLFQMAVYATRLRPEMTDSLFTQATLQ